MAKMFKYLFFIFCTLVVSVVNGQDSLYEPEPEVDTYTGSTYQSRPEFRYYDSIPKVDERKINQEALDRVRKDDDYWYANADFTKKVEEPPAKGKSWVSSLVWIMLIGGFIALLVWLLSNSNITLLRRRPDELDESPEEHKENIFELNFDAQIQAAINEKNFRLAVRLMYLQVLRIMVDRNMIKYAPEKTNGDYLFQLSSTRYYTDFFRLTRNFDYVWYGKFPVSEESFEILKKDFFTFKQALK